MKLHEMSTGAQTLINMAITAYITVMGRSKWDSLTTEQQHDAIMYVISDLERHTR